MTLGEQLLAELARRGERGHHFSYAGAQQLRRVDSRPELALFLQTQGVGVRELPPTVEGIADALRAARPTGFGSLWGMLPVDALLLGGWIVLPFLLLGRLLGSAALLLGQRPVSPSRGRFSGRRDLSQRRTHTHSR